MTKIISNPELANPDPLYSIADSSTYLNCAEISIRQWVREKKLPACHVQGRVFIRRSSLDAFIEDGYRPRGYRSRKKAAKPKTSKRRHR